MLIFPKLAPIFTAGDKKTQALPGSYILFHPWLDFGNALTLLQKRFPHTDKCRHDTRLKRHSALHVERPGHGTGPVARFLIILETDCDNGC